MMQFEHFLILDLPQVSRGFIVILDATSRIIGVLGAVVFLKRVYIVIGTVVLKMVSDLLIPNEPPANFSNKEGDQSR